MKNPVEIMLHIKKETYRAYLVTDDEESGVYVWIPKSQVKTEEDCGPGDTVEFTMSEWVAMDRGFV